MLKRIVIRISHTGINVTITYMHTYHMQLVWILLGPSLENATTCITHPGVPLPQHSPASSTHSMLMERMYPGVAGCLQWSVAIQVSRQLGGRTEGGRHCQNDFESASTGGQPKRSFTEEECNSPAGYAMLPNPRRVSMEFHNGTGNPDTQVLQRSNKNVIKRTTSK